MRYGGVQIVMYLRGWSASVNVNDVSFHMSKEQFLTYIKNQHRLIDFSYDSYIEAEKSTGLLTIFHRKPID